MRPKKYPYSFKKQPIQNLDRLFHNIEIKPNNANGVPTVILDGVDIVKEGGGLVSVNLNWETLTDNSSGKNTFSIEYLNKKGQVVKLTQGAIGF
ncbi:hypothetical protein [Streptococcus vestibularis]|jgi:hypothetical protein|uniref:Uncharacterized protein n=1 Tax=Streptococcus vestibularis TaxID=1343 RepID=A0AAW7QHT0_STRVE|nr:hypothetical protein [Streptococcus vestibularis]MDU2328293.1 hypothetical protein [Streptococcus salivarius]UVY43932.1 MAG: hypothetical protein [Bacteriophage sp.]DAS10127.1 MAG TPA: hypothetical protein [Caudoviricetes sp.]MCB8556829.1 hypothetical protein [Streptococcus vestibularis]MCB8587619.1 hypothetical protein [Streptococcus vestibularis]